MRIFSAKKLFFVVCFVAITISSQSFAKTDIEKKDDNLIISIENGRRKKKIILEPVNFKEVMNLADKKKKRSVFNKQLAQAKKELAAFDKKLTMIGENLKKIQEASVAHKDEIAMFLLMQIPAIIDLRVALEPTVALGQMITMGDGRIILDLLKRTRKKGEPESKKTDRAKIKALVSTKLFLKKKYPKIRALADRLQAVGQTASALVEDLERKRKKAS